MCIPLNFDCIMQELTIRVFGAGPSPIKAAEKKMHQTRMNELIALNAAEQLTDGCAALRLDPLSTAVSTVFMPNAYLIGQTTEKTAEITDANVLKFHTIFQQQFIPLLAQAESESVGARAEGLRIIRLVRSGQYLPVASSPQAAELTYSFLEDAWGQFSSALMKACSTYSFGRHSTILRYEK